MLSPSRSRRKATEWYLYFHNIRKPRWLCHAIMSLSKNPLICLFIAKMHRILSNRKSVFCCTSNRKFLLLRHFSPASRPHADVRRTKFRATDRIIPQKWDSRAGYFTFSEYCFSLTALWLHLHYSASCIILLLFCDFGHFLLFFFEKGSRSRPLRFTSTRLVQSIIWTKSLRFSIADIKYNILRRDIVF